jgi:pyruvate/2-oxoacid:ferredoxin oxidoreductase beta subunit
MSTPVVKSSFYAGIIVYQPFILGGDVNETKRFRVDAESVKLLKKYDCFVFERKGRWYLYEVTTGMQVCSDKTRDTVIDQAMGLIREHKKQFEQQLKKTPSIDTLSIMSSVEAWKKFDKIDR